MHVRDVILEAGRLGFLIEPAAADLLATAERPAEIMRSLASAAVGRPIITSADLATVSGRPTPIATTRIVVAASGSIVAAPPLGEVRVTVPPPAALWTPAVPASVAPLASVVPVPSSVRSAAPAAAPRRAPGFEPLLEVLDDVTGNSTCEGSIQDFRAYFQHRFSRLRKLLGARPELAGSLPVRRAVGLASNEVRFIGMVTEVRKTKNGHTLLEVEDETGIVPVLAPAREDRHVVLGEGVMQDEVVGIIGKKSRKDRDGRQSDLIILEELVRPDVPLHREPRRAERETAVAFVSDIHVGSKTFLTAEWDRFVAWMNLELGTDEQKRLARMTRYLLVVGDVVDGVGVYPDQERNLFIEDIREQYKEAAAQFARLPEDLTILVLPGNHDAVRPAEPQPAFPDRYRAAFPKNVRFVGNPCRVSLEGVEILAYHGVSIIDYIGAVPGLRKDRPADAMREMLRRRHIAPMYGGKTPLAPERQDHLLIEHVPDIFVTGHMHYCGIDDYRGTLLVNSSCWQSRTDYQKMLGIEPEPARVPIVDLRTGDQAIMNFSGERARSGG